MRRFLAAAVALCWCAAAQAQSPAEADRYAACMELARAAPADGLREANAWLGEKETVPGRHCRAAALSGLGRTQDAADALQELGANLEKDDPAMAAGLYRQAAMVQLEAGRLDEAEELQERGLKLAPDSVELLMDRALLLGAREDFDAALKVLDHARALAPARADLLVLTASAHRLLGQTDRAEESVAAALSLEPDNPAALLERGIMRRLDGDKEGARADWERVRALAPASPEAETAAANLKLLEAPAPIGAGSEP
jgi:tetratricopeptide (TPR) repeat protein